MTLGDENEVHKEIEQQDESTEANDSPESNLEDDIGPSGSEDLKSEYEDLQDRFIRLAADFDNYKKLASKRKEDVSRYGNEKLIRQLLSVLDHLQLAVDHFDPEGDINSLAEGIKLIQNQLLTTLQKFDLSPVSAQKGAKFDPMLHQAVEMTETSETAPGLILDELVRGYILNGRLLRPASVTVSTDVVKQKNDDINKGKAPEQVEEIEKNENYDSDSGSDGGVHD